MTAAVLAAVALRSSRRATRDALNALARERRLQHELDILKDLAERWGQDVRSAQVIVLLRLLPPDELPLARALCAFVGSPVPSRMTRAELLALLDPTFDADDPNAIGNVWHVRPRSGDAASVQILALSEIEGAIDKRLHAQAVAANGVKRRWSPWQRHSSTG